MAVVGTKQFFLRFSKSCDTQAVCGCLAVWSRTRDAQSIWTSPDFIQLEAPDPKSTPRHLTRSSFWQVMVQPSKTAAPVEAAAAAGHLGRNGWIDRTEYIRLMQQALCSLGYESLAHRLEAESVRHPLVN